MWSPLSKLLELIAKPRLPFLRGRENLVVGQPGAVDARGTMDWAKYLDARRLSACWGPHPHGPWAPFHCITLFVALDYLDHKVVGPADKDPWPVDGFQAPSWIDPATLLIVDLPGPRSVGLGAALAVSGCDLVCTFNNWPHPRGLLRSQDILAALLRYATLLEHARTAYPTPAPVAWLCDVDRMGKQPGKPGDFDNRYYIEDALMPGTRFLRDRGIEKVVFVEARLDQLNSDLTGHLHAYQKDGIQVMRCIAQPDGTLGEPHAIAIPDEKFRHQAGFMKSTAGGFGAPVPHPSSGG